MNQAITRRLIALGQEQFRKPAAFVEFARHRPADELLNDLSGHPHAFVLACLSDRQIKAERAWRIPHDLAQRIGGFSFERLRALSAPALRRAFTRPTPLHRFPDAMSALFHAAIERVATLYEGDASRIWSGRPSSATVVLRFLAFEGIGPKIATMATNLLARDLKVPLSDYASVDVSVDVHVRRVLARLGLIEPGFTLEQVVYTARAICPEFPGVVDLPLWEIGRTWCRPRKPDCGACVMREVCPSAGRVSA